MKLLLTGATGFVGGEVLRQALEDPEIERVTVLVRKSVGLNHPKLHEIVLKSFLDYSPAADQVNADACIWCLGVSQTEVSREQYIEITYGYAMAALGAMLRANPNLRFCFLSGRGADPEEQASTLYKQIKGRTERELSKLSPNVFHFRPAFIKPAYPGQKRPLAPTVFLPLAWVIDKFTDDFSVGAATLSRALIDVAKRGASEKLLRNRELRNWPAPGTSP
ncbi:NAD-dependent epimerase/dehydratase family protein [Hyalangium versicolor]|uniref:NAD-dependent epimerase/dehydratase family protein n=1 Tax=Hyalangium versicolor TaxID=2861190 RepID=UPI001CCB93D0|nr:NAD-dependent epimerase/dehydratase family protein [Hyalangium versicolor]